MDTCRLHTGFFMATNTETTDTDHGHGPHRKDSQLWMIFSSMFDSHLLPFARFLQTVIYRQVADNAIIIAP